MTIVNKHVRTVPRERGRGSVTDPARCSGNKRCFVGKITRNATSLSARSVVSTYPQCSRAILATTVPTVAGSVSDASANYLVEGRR